MRFHPQAGTEWGARVRRPAPGAMEDHLRPRRHALGLCLLVACGPRTGWLEVVSAPEAASPVEAVPMDAAARWYARALLAAAHHDLAEAERAMAWVLRLDEDHPVAWARVGQLRAELGLPAAESTLRRALERAPELGEAGFSLAILLAGRADPEADRWFRFAGERAVPGACERWHGAGGGEPALSCWVDRELDDEHRGRRGLALLAAGRPASDDLEAAMVGGSGTPGRLVAWGEAAIRECRSKEVLRWADRVGVASWEEPWRAALAEVRLTTTCAAPGADGARWEALGGAHRACGRIPVARECYRRALGVTPPGIDRARVEELLQALPQEDR